MICLEIAKQELSQGDLFEARYGLVWKMRSGSFAVRVGLEDAKQELFQRDLFEARYVRYYSSFAENDNKEI